MARKRKGRRDKSSSAGINTALHLSFSDKDLSDSSRHTKITCDSKDVSPLAKSFAVSVSGEKFYIADPFYESGELLPIKTVYRGLTYEFYMTDESLAPHLFRLSTEVDGVHEGYSQYTDGWSEDGTPGDEHALATFEVPSNAPNKLYYYCNNHGGMGGNGAAYINIEDLGQVGYSTETYKSSAVSAHFSGDAGLFVSGDGYVAADDLSLSKDFTISFWAKSEATGYSEDQCLFDFGLLTGFVESGVKSYISMPTGWSGENINIQNISNVDFTEWNHFCLMRTDQLLRYYINGTGQGRAVQHHGVLSPEKTSSVGQYYSIGCTRNYDNFYNGYMDDFFVHSVALYGRDGFTPMVEDVSGKFFSIAKDGLTAKYNASRIYLMSDGGYRDFEMYDTDSVYFKLPPVGNIIQEDDRSHSKQYIYPFSGQNVIISLNKDPNIIDGKDSATTFYLDSGDGRKAMATDEGMGWIYTEDADEHFDNNVKLLINSSTLVSPESFQDTSNQDHIIRGGKTIAPESSGALGVGIYNSTGEAKFGYSSISFPGIKNEALFVGKSSSPDWKWGSGEWTIDAWIKVVDSGSHTIMGKWDISSASTGCSWFIFTKSGHLHVSRKDTVAGCGAETSGVTNAYDALEPTSWNLISVQRNNTRNQIEIFVNGAIKGSGDIADNAALCSSDDQDLMLGEFHHTTSWPHNPPAYYGFMDSVRITKGVARYSDNFAAPTDRFPDRFNIRRTTRSKGSERGSAFRSAPGNSLEITTNLKPQNWRYHSTGDIDVNATHLIINNIQSGFTGAWTAEHWEDGNVYSSPRQVIIPDVIAGTGCVRPEITGLEARGQIMSLADPWRNCANTSNCGEDTEKPTWTGNCLDTNKTSNDIHLFPHNHSTGACGPYGWTHYRIFSGWLEGDSLPGFDADTEKRYDGSTDNKNLTFIISEEPLGGKAPRKHGPYVDCGPIANRTGSNMNDNLYREMSFAEVSGIPVTFFDYLNPFDGKFYQTSGRLLVTGNGNMHGDNAINGAACVYLAVADKIARNNCRLSQGVEVKTCLEECPTLTHCNDYKACNADPDCTPCIPTVVGPCLVGRSGGLEHECIARCGESKLTYVTDPHARRLGSVAYSVAEHVYGWQRMGFDNEEDCRANCVAEGGFVTMGAASPQPGPITYQPGEYISFAMSPPSRGVGSWVGLTSGEYAAMMNAAATGPEGEPAPSIQQIMAAGTDMGVSFTQEFGEENDGSVFYPTYHAQVGVGQLGQRRRLLRGGAPLPICGSLNFAAGKKASNSIIVIKVKEGENVTLSARAHASAPDGRAISDDSIWYSWRHNGVLGSLNNRPQRSLRQRGVGSFGVVFRPDMNPCEPQGNPARCRGKMGDGMASQLTIPKIRSDQGGLYQVTAQTCVAAGMFMLNKKSVIFDVQVASHKPAADGDCYLNAMWRKFNITSADPKDCMITKVVAYELWPSKMGTDENGKKFGDYYKNGNPTSWSMADLHYNPPNTQLGPAKNKKYKWYQGADLPVGFGGGTERKLFRAGIEFVNPTNPPDEWKNFWADNTESYWITAKNTMWKVDSLKSSDCNEGKPYRFHVDGCPEKIVYEITTLPWRSYNTPPSPEDDHREKKMTATETLAEQQACNVKTAGTDNEGQAGCARGWISADCGCVGVQVNWQFPQYNPRIGFGAWPSFSTSVFEYPESLPGGADGHPGPLDPKTALPWADDDGNNVSPAYGMSLIDGNPFGRTKWDDGADAYTSNQSDDNDCCQNAEGRDGSCEMSAWIAKYNSDGEELGYVARHSFTPPFDPNLTAVDYQTYQGLPLISEGTKVDGECVAKWPRIGDGSNTTVTYSGRIGFTWSGMTPTGYGNYSRIEGGNYVDANGFSTFPLPVGGYDRSNRGHGFAFRDEQNPVLVKISTNPEKGETNFGCGAPGTLSAGFNSPAPGKGAGCAGETDDFPAPTPAGRWSWVYNTWWDDHYAEENGTWQPHAGEDDDNVTKFNRYLKSVYVNVRHQPNRKIINLHDKVPPKGWVSQHPYCYGNKCLVNPCSDENSENANRWFPCLNGTWTRHNIHEQNTIAEIFSATDADDCILCEPDGEYPNITYLGGGDPECPRAGLAPASGPCPYPQNAAEVAACLKTLPNQCDSIGDESCAKNNESWGGGDLMASQAGGYWDWEYPTHAVGSAKAPYAFMNPPNATDPPPGNDFECVTNCAAEGEDMSYGAWREELIMEIDYLGSQYGDPAADDGWAGNGGDFSNPTWTNNPYADQLGLSFLVGNNTQVYSISNVWRYDDYDKETIDGGLQHPVEDQPDRGFHREIGGSPLTNIWAHQSSDSYPFAIYNGFIDMYEDGPESYSHAPTEAACKIWAYRRNVSDGNHPDCEDHYEKCPDALAALGAPGAGDSDECDEDCYPVCAPFDVTDRRRKAAQDLIGLGMVEQPSRYLDLMWLLKQGDKVFYQQLIQSGWNSYMHGHLLEVSESLHPLVDESDGGVKSCGDGTFEGRCPWHNHRGAAEVPYLNTYVNGELADAYPYSDV